MMGRYGVMIEVQVEADSELDAKEKVSVRMSGINDLIRDMYRQHAERLRGYYITGTVRELGDEL